MFACWSLLFIGWLNDGGVVTWLGVWSGSRGRTVSGWFRQLLAREGPQFLHGFPDFAQEQEVHRPLPLYEQHLVGMVALEACPPSFTDWELFGRGEKVGPSRVYAGASKELFARCCRHFNHYYSLLLLLSSSNSSSSSSSSSNSSSSISSSSSK